ncbi:hypothetical protein [Novosphingobium lindaniclasticum]|jgi:hypothetical protein|uniref:hypothetical protein n=1 Tax=Novosphingobium lindaniclasticum TaxID=1329895 RepID=UPI002409B474|nr:hypothetical protein [Novosphingobium lindaniclasticum]
MTRLRSLLRWVLRRGMLYLALVLAIAVAPLLAQAWRTAGDREAVYIGLRETETKLREDFTQLTTTFEEATSLLETQSASELDRRIAETRRDLAEERRRLGERRGILALYRRGPRALLDDQQGRLQLVLLTRELESLEAARLLVGRRDAQVKQREARTRFEQSDRLCREATERLQQLDRRWAYRWRSWLESAEHKTLVATRDSRCAERDAARRNLNAARYVQGSVEQAQTIYTRSRRSLAGSLNTALADLSRERAEAETRWTGTFRQKLQLWAEEWHLRRLLMKALGAFLLILAMPYLIRLLFWTVLAPLAERRAAIRIAVPGGRGEPVPPTEPSKTSVAIRLTAEEELLVRQSYLQTTSHSGAKATQWLLDWRHPLASLVSGLSFLTRLRGEGEVTTVSAVRDPFAEVAILTLPEGCSCVLQPRALAAVAQPLAKPLRITSHWRLGSLNAWLTLQLRYLVFHGPCRLVIKGGRGVRVEKAERGRVFGQAQLVGFSADLAYSVTRTETFWPYFLGYEQLFKDKVEAGAGVLIVEEAPMASLHGEVRHGLEGAFDVMTKALGI